MVGTSEASKKPMTVAAEMREKARRYLEAAERQRNAAARMAFHERALRLAIEAEKLDRSSTDDKLAT